jgi:RNA polymerase sigma factor (sigma-70 family)
MFLKIFQKKTKPTTDAEYVSAYRQAGDLEVLSELYGKYMEMVFAICYKYLRNEDAAKDATMEIFEKLITDLRSHDVQNFKSWLHSVARNYCLMELRSQRVEVEHHDFLGDDFMENEPSEHQYDDWEIENDLSKLEKCLETLNSEQKSTVDLFYLQEKSYKEIVETTGFDLNKVKSYIQNGKRNLKNCIESEAPPR